VGREAGSGKGGGEARSRCWYLRRRCSLPPLPHQGSDQAEKEVGVGHHEAEKEKEGHRKRAARVEKAGAGAAGAGGQDAKSDEKVVREEQGTGARERVWARGAREIGVQVDGPFTAVDDVCKGERDLLPPQAEPKPRLCDPAGKFAKDTKRRRARDSSGKNVQGAAGGEEEGQDQIDARDIDPYTEEHEGAWGVGLTTKKRKGRHEEEEEEEDVEVAKDGGEAVLEKTDISGQNTAGQQASLTKAQRRRLSRERLLQAEARRLQGLPLDEPKHARVSGWEGGSPMSSPSKRTEADAKDEPMTKLKKREKKRQSLERLLAAERQFFEDRIGLA
jgi:hypothetical protein